MELESYYEITRTADFIRSRNFSIVALQFPDQLLKDSTRVVSALRDKLRGIKESDIDQEVDENEIRLFVMADTTYGNCCIDEVGAAHVDANCVIHYGHTCLSPTTMLPAFFVLGKASINVASCVKNISDCVLTIGKPIVVLFGLEYAHSVGQIKEALIESLGASQSKLEVCFANVNSSIMNPSKDKKNYDGLQGQGGDCSEDNYFLETADNKYNIGGLIWNLLEGLKIEEYLIFWIGCENSAFTNVVLTLNGCEIGS